MKILVVAATRQEIAPFLMALGETYADGYSGRSIRTGNHEIKVLVTGAGMVATAYELGRLFAVQSFDLAINVGICGSFRNEISIGEVVRVARDSVGDMGAEDRGSWLSMADLGLMKDEEILLNDAGMLIEQEFSDWLLHNFRAVRGVTVNTVHGNAGSIKRFSERTGADIESMEGAAFMFACSQAGCRCLQIRSVSNFIEPRDKSKWNVPLAIANLNKELIRLLIDQ